MSQKKDNNFIVCLWFYHGGGDQPGGKRATQITAAHTGHPVFGCIICTHDIVLY